MNIPRVVDEKTPNPSVAVEYCCPIWDPCKDHSDPKIPRFVEVGHE